MKLIFAAGPTTCGKPEQPPNSTLISTDFNVNSRIEYVCDEGHLLVGPARRSCLPTGFYSEFPPVCRCECQQQEINLTYFQNIFILMKLFAHMHFLKYLEFLKNIY